MLICDITQSYAAISGGIKTYILEKKKFIAHYTHGEHLLIIPGAENSIKHDGRFITCTVKAPMVPNYKPYRFMFNMRQVYRLLRTFQPDVIEFASPFILPWPIFLYRRNSKCLVTGYYHTDFPRAYIKDNLPTKTPRILADFLEKTADAYAKLVYRQCDAVFSGSPSYLQQLKKWQLPKVRFVPLGVDLITFNPDKRDVKLRKELGIDTTDKLLIYCGRLGPEKQIGVLLNAIKKLPANAKIKTLIVGDGPLREHVEQEVTQNASLFFRPYETSRNALARILASADVFVTAAPHETFGLLILEAQACGLPVVGVHSGALIDRVKHGTGVLCESNNPTSLASTINEFLSKDVQRMGTSSRLHVEKSYSWNRTFTLLLKIYRGLQVDHATMEKEEHVHVQVAQ
ncbi:MAG: glycosyltransferase family 1 protein [Calditrichaeota bacterium]|nr:MAG: glycosyltransferase family 1 protein [Calditrichota bacterium]